MLKASGISLVKWRDTADNKRSGDLQVCRLRTESSLFCLWQASRSENNTMEVDAHDTLRKKPAPVTESANMYVEFKLE